MSLLFSRIKTILDHIFKKSAILPYMVAGKVGMVDGVVEAAEAANNCKK